MARRTSPVLWSPFLLLQRFFTDDIAELLNDQRGGDVTGRSRDRDVEGAAWTPNIDVIQKGNELVIRADLPGMKPEDVVVQVGDDAITISGERRQEREEERGGVYVFERSYGAFSRVIPLPEGTMVDQAKASFKDGVLEVTVPAPPEQVSRGRRLEISRGENAGNRSATAQAASSGARS